MINKSMYMRVTITLEQSPEYELSSLNAVKTVIETDMIECNIHGWFKLFDQVLRGAGFSEEIIMKGGCELAFNEWRKPEVMRRVAEEYDLKMVEFADDDQPQPIDEP